MFTCKTKLLRNVKEEPDIPLMELMKHGLGQKIKQNSGNSLVNRKS